MGKFVKDHSCQLNLLGHYFRQVPTRVIMSLITPKLQEDGCIIHPKDVIGEVRADHDIDILYSKVWKANEYAQNLIYRDPWHSFQMLSLEKENPRTIMKLKMEEKNRFEYSFMAFGPCINGFRECCKPLIVIDGIHMKGKFQDIMFVTATKDAKESQGGKFCYRSSISYMYLRKPSKEAR